LKQQLRQDNSKVIIQGSVFPVLLYFKVGLKVANEGKMFEIKYAMYLHLVSLSQSLLLLSRKEIQILKKYG
jgi:hypothetical protein